MTDPRTDPTIVTKALPPTSALPFTGADQRVGEYLLAERDLYRVTKLVDAHPPDELGRIHGDQHGYTKIVAEQPPTSFIIGPDGKLKGEDVLWITPLLAKQSVTDTTDLKRCLEIWLVETVGLRREDVLAGLGGMVAWMIEAVVKGEQVPT